MDVVANVFLTISANFITLKTSFITSARGSFPCSEFLKLSVMVPNLSATRRVYIFIGGLDEPPHGFVKSTKPTTLQDAIERARDIQDAFPKAKATFQHKPFFPSKGKYEKAPLSKERQNKKSSHKLLNPHYKEKTL